MFNKIQKIRKFAHPNTRISNPYYLVTHEIGTKSDPKIVFFKLFKRSYQ